MGKEASARNVISIMTRYGDDVLNMIVDDDRLETAVVYDSEPDHRSNRNEQLWPDCALSSPHSRALHFEVTQ